MDFTTYKATRLKLANGGVFDPPPDIVLRDATDAEVGRLKGDALRLAGVVDQARATLIAPYVRGDRDSELLAALGIAELEVGQTDRARKFLEKAAEGKTRRATAWIELGRLRLAEAKTKPAAVGNRLDAAQLVHVLAPLFEARRCQPVLPDTYRLIAEAWRCSYVRPTAAQLEVLEEGFTRFPRDDEILVGIAETFAVCGYAEKAAAYAELGFKVTKNSETRSRLEEIRAKAATSPPPRS
jgi:tetratricopeptide (TPR) repeat protein